MRSCFETEVVDRLSFRYRWKWEGFPCRETSSGPDQSRPRCLRIPTAGSSTRTSQSRSPSSARRGAARPSSPTRCSSPTPSTAPPRTPTAISRCPTTHSRSRARCRRAGPASCPGAIRRAGQASDPPLHPRFHAPDYLEEMDRFVGMCFAHGRTCLFVDEVHEGAPADRTPPHMRRALRQGRHRRPDDHPRHPAAAHGRPPRDLPGRLGLCVQAPQPQRPQARRREHRLGPQSLRRGHRDLVDIGYLRYDRPATTWRGSPRCPRAWSATTRGDGLMLQTRTHALLFAREELDEVQNAVVRLEMEFNERKPFIEREAPGDRRRPTGRAAHHRLRHAPTRVLI